MELVCTNCFVGTVKLAVSSLFRATGQCNSEEIRTETRNREREWVKCQERKREKEEERGRHGVRGEEKKKQK